MRGCGKFIVTWVAVLLWLMTTAVASAGAPASGAIFTSNSTCDGANVNSFGSKADVYLDGGPAHPGAAGLPDGDYWVQVTEPNGTLLGKSQTVVATVSGGEFVQCYQLTSIVYKASDSSTKGFDDTTNGGGEYKVWASKDPTFPESASKTDAFKVGAGASQGNLEVIKFYDANANGIYDDPKLIVGWKVNIKDGIDWNRDTPVDISLAPDEYTVTEYMPVETNWMATTPNPVSVKLDGGETETVEFGNLCLGSGGGLTLGFWSNKNGQALIGSDDLALLVGLNLRDANGSNFDPTGNTLRTWLLNANATNMAYMLSAQLAAMELNVLNGKVSGFAWVYAPGILSANDLGFAKIGDLMAEANIELGNHGSTLADSPYRAYQEALKNALDKANNNKTFVQPEPCAFNFAS